MVRRTFVLLCIVASPAYAISCSSSDPSPASDGAAADCVAINDAVAVANASLIAAERVSEAAYPYQFTVESTEILACEAGVTVLEAGLRDSAGEVVSSHRYLIARDPNGRWHDATAQYTVTENGEYNGMNCAAMPPAVAAQYSRRAPGELVEYPGVACTAPEHVYTGECDPQTIGTNLDYAGEVFVDYCDKEWGLVNIGHHGDNANIIQRVNGTWVYYANLIERRCVSGALADGIPAALVQWFDSKC